MKTEVTIKQIADALYAESMKNVDTLVSARGTGVKADIDAKSFTELIEGIDAQFSAVRVDGVGLPEHLISGENYNGYGVIVVRSKLRAENKYRRETKIAIDDNFITNAAKFISDVLFEMYYIETATENLKDLNAEIAQICADNDIPYVFSFKSEPTNSALVIEIDDAHIIFNASLNSALKAGSLAIMLGGDEYSDYVKADAVATLVKQLKAIQTTPELIKGKVNVIDKVVDYATKKRASNLIREAYHRQAKNLDAVENKEMTGYFDEVVTIDGNEVEVFALVHKDANEYETDANGKVVKDANGNKKLVKEGAKTVVLKPFDVKTNLVVDFDVLKAI